MSTLATALLEAFKEKYLINTIEKAKKCKTYDILRRLLRVNKNQTVVCADGVRFAVQKCRADHNTQKKTWDVKHGFNGISFIGITMTDDGKFCGFYPEKGTYTDGAHWDGRVIDYLALNNIDYILALVIPNSQPFEDDGTLVIMDRCLGNGCYMLFHGIIWYKYPCCSKLKVLTVQQANRTRLDATLHRWINEGSFAKLKNYWTYFKKVIHYKLVRITGKWLNICASILNYFEIGMVKMSAERLEVLTFMEYQVSRYVYAPHELNPHYQTVKYFRYDNKLVGTDFNGNKIHYWHRCNSLIQVTNMSTYWTKEKLMSVFNLTEKEFFLVGGGTFTIQQGYSYMVNSSNEIAIYVSTFKQWEKLLMIRNIKRKNTSKSSIKTRKDDLTVSANPVTHHVILSERDKATYERDDVNDFPERAKNLFWCCNCIAGSKTCNADSHVMASLLYLKYVLHGKKVPKHLAIEKYWSSIIHVGHLQQRLSQLTYQKTHVLLTQWLKDWFKE